MTTQSILSNPALQHVILGLVCGILLGLGHNISRRLLEAAAVLGALAILFFMVTGDGASLQEIDFTVLKSWLARWKFDLAGLIVGGILGYSIVEGPRTKGKSS